MDEMRFETKLFKSFIAHWFKKKIKEKFDYNVDIIIEELKLTTIDETGYLHVNLNATIPKNDLNRFMNNVG